MSIDDFPTRDENSDLEATGEAAFETCVTKAGHFIVQQRDRRDYGTDFLLEAKEGAGATNFRLHVQLKATDTEANRDGSLSVSVDRRNLNYLLSQPHSTYVCFHRPTERLLARSAEDVIRDLQHSGRPWQEQASVTIRFRAPVNDEFQSKLRARVIATGRSWRNDRLRWAATKPEFIVKEVARHVPSVDLPESPEEASEILRTLYKAGRDDVISRAFESFVARFGIDDNRMLSVYLAEINLAMRRHPFDPDRVRTAIRLLESQKHRSWPGSLYCRANGHLALEEWDVAKGLFEECIKRVESYDTKLTAQCWKNLGTVYQGLGDETTATLCFEKARSIDPDQFEVSMALAEQAVARADTEAALRHLDENVWAVDIPNLALAARAHRAKLLFEGGEVDKGLDDIAAILSHAHRHEWILPWSARTVFDFSRKRPDVVNRTINFWSAYNRLEPRDREAQREHLHCLAYAKVHDQPVTLDFKRYRVMVASFLTKDDGDAAYFWDRVGHWAQIDGNWPEAAVAYRKACALEPERYGYCLGTALNHQGLFGEALPLLLDQALHHLQDDKSWFQVAIAKEGTKDLEGAIDAYCRALELNPDYELAMFNLGGIYWNQGNREKAVSTWNVAIERFPDHPSARKLQEDFPGLLQG